jgi:ribonuclease BN (tRNA processing enzyme)
MTKIVFLGTGGGRTAVVKQVRRTGGFRISSKSAEIQVDPGPGALVATHKAKLDPLTLDAIIVSHNHVDHFNDAMIMIEGMTHFTRKKRGIIIGSKRSLEKSPDDEPGVHKYHQNLVQEVYVAQFGKRKKFKTEKGEFEIEIIEMKHAEPTTFGFRLFIDEKIIGYITDTLYREEFEEAFIGCDMLIVNCIKPESDGYDGHITSNDLIKILPKIKPKTCIITHLGMKMLNGVAQKEAKRIQKITKVKTISAKDFMEVEF